MANCPAHAFEVFRIRGKKALSKTEDLFFRATLFCTAKIWVPLNVKIVAGPLLTACNITEKLSHLLKVLHNL